VRINLTLPTRTAVMTICENCGAEREFIAEACPSCGFEPKTHRELAVASLLTTEFPAGEESFGTKQEALDRIASEIRAGTRPTFNEQELLRHEQAVVGFLSVRPMDPFCTC
jgi:predicted amidophosphoribosyltransferase